MNDMRQSKDDEAVLKELVAAVDPVLRAHRSTAGHVTEYQITRAWAAYDAARAALKAKEQR